jgi:hypothetical protein
MTDDDQITLNTPLPVPPAVETPPATDPRFPLAQIIGTQPMKVCKYWEEWLNEWQNASFYQRLGLLEIGILMSRNTIEGAYQQVQFFLTLSDYEASRELREHRAEWEALSRTATEVLIRELFTNSADRHADPSWTWLMKTPELFELVLWYFRPRFSLGRVSIGAIDYADPDEAKAVMRKFLRDFCRSAWVEENYGRQPWRVQKRPQMVPILCGLGGPAIWETTDPDGAIKFDDECMKTLEQTILSIKVSLPRESGYRFPKNVQEAVSCGVECARVYMILQTIKEEEKKAEKEEARLERIEELRKELEQLGDMPTSPKTQ